VKNLAILGCLSNYNEYVDQIICYEINLSIFNLSEIFLEILKSSIGAAGDIVSVNSIRDKELWSPMLYCGEFDKDTVKSIPTTPNIQVKF